MNFGLKQSINCVNMNYYKIIVRKISFRDFNFALNWKARYETISNYLIEGV